MKNLRKIISVFIAVTMVVCYATINVSAATYTKLTAQGVGGVMSIGNTQEGSVGFANMTEYNAFMASSDNVTWSTDHPEVMKITPHTGSQASKRTCSVTYLAGGSARLFATINGVKSNPSDIASVYGIGAGGAMYYPNGTYVKPDGSYWGYNYDGTVHQISPAGTYVPNAPTATKVGSAAPASTKPSTTTTTGGSTGGGTTTTTKPSTTTTTKPSTTTGGTTTKSSTTISTKANNSTSSASSAKSASSTASSSSTVSSTADSASISSSSASSELASSDVASSEDSSAVAATASTNSTPKNGASPLLIVGIILVVLGAGAAATVIVMHRKSKKATISMVDTAEIGKIDDKK